MQISEKQLNALLAVASVKNIEKLLELIPMDSGICYTDLQKEFNKAINANMRSGFFYYLKKLVKNNILRKDQNTKTYYLTRFGIQLITLINNFKEVCREYDLSDCDADGRIVVSVRGRKM